MSAKDLPFNIKVMDNSLSRFNKLPLVTALDIFDGATKEFHPNGLFSVPFFGAVGDESRLDNFAYINLNTEVIHPFIYQHIVTLKGLYGEIMTGKAFAKWDDKTKDFERSDPINGDTGYAFFFKKVKQIKFKKSNSSKRNEAIATIEKYKDVMFCKYLIVSPAGMRDIEVKDGRTTEDEVNDFYRKAMRGATAVIGNDETTNNRVNDVARVSIQSAFNSIFETTFAITTGKKGFILGKWYSRRVAYGTANVISSKELTSGSLIKGDIYDPRVTFCGLHQAMAGNRSKVQYALKRNNLNRIFTDHEALLVGSNHQPVTVPTNDEHRNKWMSVEGIDNLIDRFGNEKLRNKPLRVGKYFISNIYDDGNTVQLFRSEEAIREILPMSDTMTDTEFAITTKTLREEGIIRHATFAEFMYLSTIDVLNELYGTVTRYPVNGFGSIYVCKVVVKTTTKGGVRVVKDPNRLSEDLTVNYFPLSGGSFLNTMQVDVTRIDGLGADFDGDRTSLIFLFSEEAIKEAKDMLDNPKNLINAVSGKLDFSCNTTIIKRAMANLSMGMR